MSSETTSILWPQFMAEVDQIARNNNRRRSEGQAIILPSWFANRRPKPTLENLHQLMANMETLLPNTLVLPSSNNPTSDSLALPIHEIANNSLAPVPTLQTTPILDSLELAKKDDRDCVSKSKVKSQKSKKMREPKLRAAVRYSARERGFKPPTKVVEKRKVARVRVSRRATPVWGQNKSPPRKAQLFKRKEYILGRSRVAARYKNVLVTSPYFCVKGFLLLNA